MKVISVDEGAPQSRPSTSPAIDAATWLRFEAWTGYRWGARDVTYTVEGPGEFVPTLRPATYTSAKVWTGDGWGDATPASGPLGKVLDGRTWQLKYSVGASAAAADATEAGKRYQQYLADAAGEAGIRSLTDGDYSVSRDPRAIARALEYSGAADLLRVYR